MNQSRQQQQRRKFQKIAENSSKRRSFLWPKYHIVSRKKLNIVSSQKKSVLLRGVSGTGSARSARTESEEKARKAELIEYAEYAKCTKFA